MTPEMTEPDTPEPPEPEPSEPDAPESARPDEVSTVGEPLWLTVAAWTVLPIVGFGLAWLVKIVAVWAEDLPWAPYQEIIKFVLRFIPEPYLTIAMCVLGAVAGLVTAILLRRAGLRITLSGDTVTLDRSSFHQDLDRSAIKAVLCSGGHLVLLGHDGGELAREPWDLAVAPVADAFRKHGYTWLDDDPHGADFRAWEPDAPELPAAANAVLRARQIMRDKFGDSQPARDLRHELAKLGVVVRDEEKTQFWRWADSKTEETPDSSVQHSRR